jgi:hypothetical protein
MKNSLFLILVFSSLIYAANVAFAQLVLEEEQEDEVSSINLQLANKSKKTNTRENTINYICSFPKGVRDFKTFQLIQDIQDSMNTRLKTMGTTDDAIKLVYQQSLGRGYF